MFKKFRFNALVHNLFETYDVIHFGLITQVETKMNSMDERNSFRIKEGLNNCGKP